MPPPRILAVPIVQFWEILVGVEGLGVTRVEKRKSRGQVNKTEQSGLKHSGPCPSGTQLWLVASSIRCVLLLLRLQKLGWAITTERIAKTSVKTYGAVLQTQ